MFRRAGWTYLVTAAVYVLVELFAFPALTAANQGIFVSEAQAFGLFRRVFGRRPRSFNRGVAVRRVPVSRFASQPVSRSYGRGAVGRNRNIVRRDDVQDIVGFSNLAQLGNQLLERNRFGQLRRLFIDRFGRLFGATEARTIRHLREFYLTNFDNFKGREKDLVRRFLLRNGAAQALTGNLRVDLFSGTLPTYAFEHLGGSEAQKQTQIAIAGLNYVLNTMSQTSRLLRVNAGNVRADGTVGLNLSGAFRSAALALWTNDNPYACGNPNTPPRLDWLIARAMDPDIYYQMLDIPRTLEELADGLGVRDDKRETLGNKIVVAGPRGENESSVAEDSKRTLEVQPQRRRPGLSFYISWDGKANAESLVQSESRDPLRVGVNFTHDASEAIFHKGNGFLSFYLANAAGARQNNAPADIALAKIKQPHMGQSVDSPVMCLECHANGFVGGGRRSLNDPNAEPYTDNFARIGARLGSFQQRFFTTNARYRAQADRDSAIFKRALLNSGSFLPASAQRPSDAAPLMPQFVSAYRAPLTVKQVAKELGLGESEAAVARVKAFLGEDRDIPPSPTQGVISRKEFEKQFCTLRRIIGGSSGVFRSALQDGVQSRGLVSPGARGQNHSGSVPRGSTARPLAR